MPCKNYFLILFGFNFFFFFSSFIDVLHAQATKTYYVGHSLTDQIPDMLQSLSDDDTAVDFDWLMQSIPGAPLSWNWEEVTRQNNPPIPPHYYDYYEPTHGLQAGDYDVLVLTESVPRHLNIIDLTYIYADSFYQYATQYNPDIRIYIYEVWHCLLSGTPNGCAWDVDSNPWRQRLTDDLPMWESVVDTLNAKYSPTIPVCLIPGGQGLARLYDSIQVGAVPGISNITQLFNDNIHLTDVGKYFMACIHFASIHGKSPVGLTNQTQVWWGGDFDPPTPAQALKFQEIAWETVLDYPANCLPNSTAVDVFLEQDNIKLLPNPTDQIFEIEGLIGSYTIEILNAQGNLHQTITSASNRVEIDLQDLPNGLYFIKIQNDLTNVLSMQKILKQN